MPFFVVLRSQNLDFLPIFVTFSTFLFPELPENRKKVVSLHAVQDIYINVYIGHKEKRMHYAIIAAGEGSRLAQEGIPQPKPLVPLAGEPMIARLLGIFLRQGADHISVIVNRQMTEVHAYLEAWRKTHLQVTLQLLVESTPSSMHSLSALCQIMPDGPFVCTTVDTIFRESDFARYVQDFGQSQEFRFVVTPYVDDEKPLWVSTDADGHIAAFSDQGPAPYVSGGIYGMDKRTILPILENCLVTGQSRMRNFQRALLEAGVVIRASVFDQVMDIDHKSDIQKAESFLAGGDVAHLRCGLIYRAEEYSPNGNVPKDAAILEAVGLQLQSKGHEVRYWHEEHLPQAVASGELSDLQCVVSMARRWKSLLALQQLEREGVSVLNRPSAVQVTVQSRSTTLEMLQAAGVLVVPFWSYEPSEDQMFQCEPELQQLLPGWVKAMHPRGVTSGDVLRVETPLQADSRILELAAEGYTDIIVTRHLEGPLVKVYAVGEHCWPDAQYAELVQRVRAVLGLEIFGIDLILTEQGPMIIDVNDFPSFSSCRGEASQAIAQIL